MRTDLGGLVLSGPGLQSPAEVPPPPFPPQPASPSCGCVNKFFVWFYFLCVCVFKYKLFVYTLYRHDTFTLLQPHKNEVSARRAPHPHRHNFNVF